MKNCLNLIASFLLISTINSQIVINGRVINDSNKEPLSDVNIVVYVSCNFKTFERDAKVLLSNDFMIDYGILSSCHNSIPFIPLDDLPLNILNFLDINLIHLPNLVLKIIS